MRLTWPARVSWGSAALLVGMIVDASGDDSWYFYMQIIFMSLTLVPVRAAASLACVVAAAASRTSRAFAVGVYAMGPASADFQRYARVRLTYRDSGAHASLRECRARGGRSVRAGGL